MRIFIFVTIILLTFMFIEIKPKTLSYIVTATAAEELKYNPDYIGLGFQFIGGSEVISSDNTVRMNNIKYGFGLLYDYTEPAKILSHRLSFRVERSQGFIDRDVFELKKPLNPNMPYLLSFALDGSLGAGTFIDGFKYRIWCSPQIRLSYSEAVLEDNSRVNGIYGISIAPVIGLDYQQYSRLTHSIEFGYRITNYYGFDDIKRENLLFMVYSIIMRNSLMY